MHTRKDNQRGSTPPQNLSLEEFMRQKGIPVTRQSYLNLNYLGKPPKALTAEEELELPAGLRRLIEDDLESQPSPGATSSAVDHVCKPKA
jgi:hypothetical protein